MPMLIFDRSFGDLDVYAELDYIYGFTKESDEDGKEVNPQYLDFELDLAYNIGLGSGTTVSLLLENLNRFRISPKSDKFGNSFIGILAPGIKFNQGTAFGDLFVRADLPITYRYFGELDDFTSGLDFTAGWGSTFGFGIEFTAYNDLTPDFKSFTWYDVLASFETRSFYAEVLFEIPREFDDYGMFITPHLELYFGNFTIYGFCEFAGIGSDWDTSISPGVGVKFSF
jgi:hypothetical protein